MGDDAVSDRLCSIETTEVTLVRRLLPARPPSLVADMIMRTIELGVAITDAAVDEKATTIFCAPAARNPRCPDCGHGAATATP